MSVLESNDGSIYYNSAGGGEALILIPGFASGAWTWFRQIEDLAENSQVITFDPRGISQSRIADGAEVSLAAIADDAAALLDELKIEKASVLGVSFGGFVAQEFALKYPHKLNKLILACTSFGGKNHVAPSLEVLAAFAALEDLNKKERIRKFIVPAFTPEFLAYQADIVEHFCRLREQNFVPETIYMQQLLAATTFDAEARITGIQAETLILTGNADIVVPPQNSVNLAQAIPNARLKIIENGSHLFFVEKAGEFNQAVTDFIK